MGFFILMQRTLFQRIMDELGCKPAAASQTRKISYNIHRKNMIVSTSNQKNDCSKSANWIGSGQFFLEFAQSDHILIVQVTSRDKRRETICTHSQTWYTIVTPASSYFQTIPQRASSPLLSLHTAHHPPLPSSHPHLRTRVRKAFTPHCWLSFGRWYQRRKEEENNECLGAKHAANRRWSCPPQLQNHRGKDEARQKQREAEIHRNQNQKQGDELFLVLLIEDSRRRIALLKRNRRQNKHREDFWTMERNELSRTIALPFTSALLGFAA